MKFVPIFLHLTSSLMFGHTKAKEKIDVCVGGGGGARRVVVAHGLLAAGVIGSTAIEG